MPKTISYYGNNTLADILVKIHITRRKTAPVPIQHVLFRHLTTVYNVI